MDIVINDYSLNGQFDTIDDFVEDLNINLLPTFEQFNNLSFSVFKSHNTYELKVTSKKTLYDVFMINGDPSITKLKSILSNIMCDEPYWTSDPKTDCTAQYICEYTDNFINCFTEAYERDGILFSFTHELFLNKCCKIYKNNEMVDIKNCFNKHILLEHLLKTKEIDLIYFWSNIELKIEIEFARRNTKTYLEEVLDNSLSEEDIFTVKEDLITMVNNIYKGISSRFSRHMINESFLEFRTSISDGREFRMFYIYSNFKIIFLNCCIKKIATHTYN